MNNDFVEYSETIGKIVANLQSLEFSLRLYLHNTQTGVSAAVLPKLLHELTVGEVVPETPLTDWSTLSALIDRFNRSVSKDRPELVVSKSVVEIRDALAHGRMWLPDMSAAPVLLKFEKPASGSTRVTFLQVSSGEWLNNTIVQIHGEMIKVQAALGHA